jgi:hypothetical protein
MITKYKLLGSDGQEYETNSAEQIKQWIMEGRVERKTPILIEGAKDWNFLEMVPEFAEAFQQQPPPVRPAAPKSESGGGLNAIIPYKNVRALLAYYFGVFSVIPMLGILLGLLAFVLGISALYFRRKNPAAGGVVHAWIGILVGGFFGFGWLAVTIWFLVVIAGHQPHAQPLITH